ncbi:MAG: metallophosphoesterase family protein, partial [Opitutaceae bacterium]
QFARKAGRTTVVNPGSVGQPKDGDPRAAYALWEDGRVSLKRASYDIALTVRDLAGCAEPGIVRRLSEILIHG